MFWMAGAAGVALDALATLQKTLSSPAAAAGGAATPFALNGGADPARAATNGNAVNAIAPSTLNALISLQGQPGETECVSSAIFSTLDTNSDGQLSQSEFTAAFKAGGAGHGLAQLMQKQAQLLATPGQSIAMTA